MTVERIGILLAAGRSRRMGTTKQLLPWPPPDGASTLVAASFDALRAMVDAMVVVLGHDAAAVRDALGARPCEVIETDPDAEMHVSIQRGLTAARRHAPAGHVVVHPADHPVIPPPVRTLLLGQAAAHPDRAVMPVYDGRGGHPVLIPATMIAELIAAPLAGGLRRYWVDHADRAWRVDVSSADVVRDMDEPRDYVGG